MSSGLISIATKTRILQDSYDLSVNDSECCPEKAAFEEIPNIVQVVEGEFKNSIRECCNKIIHATSFDLDFSLDYYGTEYWTGWCVLKGRHFKNQWSVKINIFSFSVTLRNFIEIIRYL